MSWLILIFAGLFEIAWAVGLRLNGEVIRPWLLIVTACAIVLSMWLLAASMKQIPMGTAYAIWTGIGALGTFAVGILYFDEPLTAGRLASLLLVVAGLVGLKLTA